MKISIICPVYNGGKYIRALDDSIRAQKNVNIESVLYILTKSEDNSEELLKELDASYKNIGLGAFSHSLTREKEARSCVGDIIVFISQDITIRDDLWMYNLTRDIAAGNCEAAFSRQVCGNNGIERYIREKNYPDTSRIVSRKDLDNLGVMAFFFSDVSSAVRKDIFVKLNGYDNKDLITNEDMYFAYKLIMNNYRIKYCADSVVVHAHSFTVKQLFRRYFDTGVFFADNQYLDKYKADDSGFKLFFYTLKHAVRDKNLKVIVTLVPNFAARFIGMKLGRMYKEIPKRDIIARFSNSSSYWSNR